MMVRLLKITISLLFISLLVTGTFTHLQVPFIAFAHPQLADTHILYEWPYLVIGFYTTNLQMLAVLLCIMLLKPVWATVTFLIYLGLGWWGLPVFYYGGGSAYLQQASLGYLLGLVPSCWVFYLFYQPQRVTFVNLFGSAWLTWLGLHMMGSLYAGFYLQILPIEFLLIYTIPQWLWQTVALAACSFLLAVLMPRKPKMERSTSPKTQWRQAVHQA